MAKTLRSSQKGDLRRSIKGNLPLNSEFRSSTLDLNFAKTKSLRNSVDNRDLVTFTRASTGTYVDSDGLIKTSPYNLLEYSEQIGFAGFWNINNAASGTVTLNSATAPDGTTTATTVVSSADFYGPNNFTVVPASTVYTFSVWVKNLSETIAARINVFGKFVSFLNGALSNIDPTLIATSIEPFPNNWYRITLTADSGAGGNLAVALYGNAGNSFQCWGAQLEEGSTATTYIPTTSVASGAPRFDHDPVTGECLGLLIEEARTNLIDNSSGSTMTPLTVTKQTVSELNPEGVSSCLKITADSSSSANGVRVALPGTSSANNTTVSAFVKKDTYRYVQIGFGGLSNSYTALFDIEPNLTSNRLLGQGGKGTYTNIDAGYTDYQNGWIRIWASGTTTGSDGPTIALSPDNVSYSINNWTPVGTEAVLLYGIQYEDNAAFPTSYIPTSGSTVTRSADIAEITGSNFTSFYNQTEGTFFADIVGMPITTGQFPRIYDINDGTPNNVIRSQQYGSNIVRNNVVSGGTTNMAKDGGTIAEGSKGKTAFAVAENNCAIVTDGGTPAVDNTVTLPTNLDRFGILGTTGGTSMANSTISRLSYWTERLDNAKLIKITS